MRNLHHILFAVLLLAMPGILGCASPHVHARHILISIPPNASESVRMQKLQQIERVRAALIEGAGFEATAKQHSDCPSKQRGGDLGVFSRGQMVKPFEKAAFTQQVGEIGPIVKTRFGYHIVQVLDRGKLK